MITLKGEEWQINTKLCIDKKMRHRFPSFDITAELLGEINLN